MLVNPGIRRATNFRGGIPLSNLAARFDANSGVTSSGGFASQWNDISGNGRHLLQASGPNQPIHLPYAGSKYAFLAGTTNNYISTPDSVASSITGSRSIVAGINPASLTPANYKQILDKINAGATTGYALSIDTAGSGKLIYAYDTSGTLRTAVSTVTLSSVGVVAGTPFRVAVTHDTSTGTIKFYYATGLSGGGWTQLGATIAGTSGAGTDDTTLPCVGNRQAAPASVYEWNGGIYFVKLYSGVVSDFDTGTGGTLAVDFDASRWTSGTTFTGSTGETWTINSTGSKPAQIVDRPSLLFDGTAHYMKCSAFTLNQPETVYLVAKQVSWTNQDYFFDGNSTNTGVLFQNNATPQLSIYAGSIVGADTNLAVGSRGVVGVVFNGAASSLQVNGNASATVSAGAANMGGFTLAANAAVSNFGNIQAYEALIYSVAHDATTRANVIRALMAKWSVT